MLCHALPSTVSALSETNVGALWWELQKTLLTGTQFMLKGAKFLLLVALSQGGELCVQGLFLSGACQGDNMGSRQ